MANGCVERKIPILKREHPDWSEDQVVAVAYSYCGESDKSYPSPEALPASDRALWEQTFVEVYAQTGDDLKAALAAWGSLQRQSVFALVGKSASGAARGYRLGGWAMKFTDADALDLNDMYFDRHTETLLDYYLGAPLWMEHGRDPNYGIAPIGRRVLTQVYPFGVWLEHDLDPEHPLYAKTCDGINNGEFGYSTDTLPNYSKRGLDPATGRLGAWFAAGCSLTRTPAEPGLGAVTFQEFSYAVKSMANAKAREAQGDVPATVLFAQHATGDDGMNPELLKKLAAFVGVEAGADGSLDALAVKAAMQTLIDKVSAKEDAPPTGEAPADAQPTLPDLAQLRAALGLPADADNAAIAAQLQSLLNMLLEPAPEGMSGKSYDFASLQGAMALAAKSAPPLPSGIPAVHRGADKPGEKNRQYGSVNFNRGAKKPGLADMVNDLLAGKSATYQTGVLGGYVVREEVRDELLPLLRSKLVLEQAGATVTMMPDFAALDVPKMTKAPAAYWVGANQDVPEDDAEYGTMKLVPKQIASIARIPMRLLQIAPAQVEQRIRDEITTSIRLKIDYAGLYGTGAITGSNNGAEPLGLVNMTGVTKTTLATNGRAPVPKDMSDAKKRVEADNVELDASAHWLYHPNVLNYFEDLTDTTGQLLNKSQWQKGYAPLTTTQIPTNLTTGSSNDTTDIFFGRWNYLEMGLGNQIEIMVLDQLYARSLQVGIMAYTYADFIAHYPEAFDVIRGVRIA